MPPSHAGPFHPKASPCPRAGPVGFGGSLPHPHWCSLMPCPASLWALAPQSAFSPLGHFPCPTKSSALGAQIGPTTIKPLYNLSLSIPGLSCLKGWGQQQMTVVVGGCFRHPGKPGGTTSEHQKGVLRCLELLWGMWRGATERDGLEPEFKF